MSLFDDIAKNTKDNVAGIPQNVMSENRNFHRPTTPFFGSTVPIEPTRNDVAFAADQDNQSKFIEQIQKTLKNGLLGIKYSGPIDGNINSVLLDSLSSLEAALEKQFPNKKFIGTIRFGTIVSNSGWNKALKAIGEIKKTTETSSISNPQQELAQPSEISKFQKFFGLQPTGQIDQNLIQKTKDIENNMIKQLNDPSIKGMLWNDTTKTFQTTVEDLSQALEILNKNKK